MKSILRVFFCFVITTHVFGQTVNPLAVSQENLILQEKWVDSVYQSLSLDEKIDAQMWLALGLVASGIFLINRR